MSVQVPVIPSTKLVLPVLRYTLDEAHAAGCEWGFNCGPAAVAAVCGLSIAELRPTLGDFESKRYTNPTLMRQILSRINIGIRSWKAIDEESWTLNQPDWPRYGLARIQWHGPWMNAAVPIAARYRQTHWVGSCRISESEHLIFDVNCLCVGGWVSIAEWSGHVVPWLIRAAVPRADGGWHLTHAIDIRYELVDSPEPANGN